MIQLNEFQRQWADTRVAVLAAVDRVGSSGWYVLGEEVSAFETSLAAFCGVAHCVGVASGLDALEVSLRVAGCRPGDKVLTTPLSAFATTLAILKLGAVPVFVDTDEFGLLDLDLAEEALSTTAHLRFIVPVHLYGHALNLTRLAQLAEKHGCTIIEDCAQAIACRFEGRAVGTAGAIAVISFYPTKNLGALGDGGAILTESETYDTEARSLRDYGQTSKYVHAHVGYNSRLDELQAAILNRVYFTKLAEWTARRIEIACRYRSGIANPGIRIPGAPPGSESVWHLFPALVAPDRKQAFRRFLASRAVASGEHYPLPIFEQPALLGAPHLMLNPCAVSKSIAVSEVSLPIHPYLTDNEIDRVIETCNEWGG
jgi:dTDP-3-amino-3,4,6-trideoxy-alpha-D-glucose transaminase